MPSDLFPTQAKAPNGSLTLTTKPEIPSALNPLLSKAVKTDRVAMNECSFEKSQHFLSIYLIKNEHTSSFSNMLRFMGRAYTCYNILFLFLGLARPLF